MFEAWVPPFNMDDSIREVQRAKLATASLAKVDAATKNGTSLMQLVIDAVEKNIHLEK